MKNSCWQCDNATVEKNKNVYGTADLKIRASKNEESTEVNKCKKGKKRLWGSELTDSRVKNDRLYFGNQASNNLV